MKSIYMYILSSQLKIISTNDEVWVILFFIVAEVVLTAVNLYINRRFNMLQVVSLVFVHNLYHSLQIT